MMYELLTPTILFNLFFYLPQTVQSNFQSFILSAFKLILPLILQFIPNYMYILLFASFFLSFITNRT